jgi:hypothetical protein
MKYYILILLHYLLVQSIRVAGVGLSFDNGSKNMNVLSLRGEETYISCIGDVPGVG